MCPGPGSVPISCLKRPAFTATPSIRRRCSRKVCGSGWRWCALVHDPPILLLDEPFAGLDAEGTAWLFRLFVDLRGANPSFVLHDEERAFRLADRVLELRQGRLHPRAAEAAAAAAFPRAA